MNKVTDKELTRLLMREFTKSELLFVYFNLREGNNIHIFIKRIIYQNINTGEASIEMKYRLARSAINRPLLERIKNEKRKKTAIG